MDRNKREMRKPKLTPRLEEKSKMPAILGFLIGMGIIGGGLLYLMSLS